MFKSLLWSYLTNKVTHTTTDLSNVALKIQKSIGLIMLIPLCVISIILGEFCLIAPISNLLVEMFNISQNVSMFIIAGIFFLQGAIGLFIFLNKVSNIMKPEEQKVIPSVKRIASAFLEGFHRR